MLRQRRCRSLYGKLSWTGYWCFFQRPHFLCTAYRRRVLGVSGVGSHIALGLAKCGFGDELLGGVQGLRGRELEDFMAGIRATICRELATNSQNMLQGCHRKLSIDFPATFPNLEVLNRYDHPAISELIPLESKKPKHPDWTSKEPSIRQLATFGQKHFGWNSEEVLKEKMKWDMWNGIFLQMVYSVNDSLQFALSSPYLPSSYSSPIEYTTHLKEFSQHQISVLGFLKQSWLSLGNN
jgi:hypothetical protein